MTDTSQQQAPLPQHAPWIPSEASESKQDTTATLLPSGWEQFPHGKINGYVFTGIHHVEFEKAGTLFDIPSFGALCHRGSGGSEMSGVVKYPLACCCDVRAVFMQHHKYACCFGPYRGIYDSGVTAFALSEVIYLSSSVTAGMNEAEDDDTSHSPDRMTLKASSGWDNMKIQILHYESF